jgi:hypothetical protein
MTHKDIIRAINVLAPEAQWTLSGDNFADLIWLDKTKTMPSLQDIEAEIANPTPKPSLTISDKLAIVGLSVDDLKAALGL